MKENKILKWALILSAVIVANLFFNYGLQLAFDGPDRDDYFPGRNDSQELCVEKGGEWIESTQVDSGPKAGGYCDTKNLYEEYDAAREDYEKKVFIALISIGVILLIASVIVKSNGAATSALALTAFIDFIVASIRYWQYSDELLKVGILFIALIVIFYLIVKKFRNSN
jgi:hypothetical protein